MNSAAIPQPPPAEGGEVVLLQVIKDLEARGVRAESKWGKTPPTSNDRKFSQAEYEEILDLVVYMRQRLVQEKPPASSLDAQVERMAWAMVNEKREIDTRLDILIEYIKANEEWKKEVNAQLAYLTTNVAYTAARQGTKPLRVSGYPRTEE